MLLNLFLDFFLEELSRIILTLLPFVLIQPKIFFLSAVQRPFVVDKTDEVSASICHKLSAFIGFIKICISLNKKQTTLGIEHYIMLSFFRDDVLTTIYNYFHYFFLIYSNFGGFCLI